MRKTESTNEMLIRRYKEGVSITTMALKTGIPANNIVSIIEKYTGEPVKDGVVRNEISAGVGQDEKKENKKTSSKLRGILTTPVAELFKKDVELAEGTLNISLGDAGFIDNKTIAVAKMINNGKDEASIKDFFSITSKDIELIKENLEVHNERYKPIENISAKNDSTTVESENDLLKMLAKPKFKPVKHNTAESDAWNIGERRVSMQSGVTSIEVFDEVVEPVAQDESTSAEPDKISPDEFTDKVVEDSIKSVNIAVATSVEPSMKNSGVLSKMELFAQRQLEGTTSKLNGLKTKYAESEIAYTKALKEMDTLNLDIITLSEKIDKLNSSKLALETTISEYESELGAREEEIKRTEDEMFEYKKFMSEWNT